MNALQGGLLLEALKPWHNSHLKEEIDALRKLVDKLVKEEDHDCMVVMPDGAKKLFVCPECGGNTLEEIIEDVVVTVEHYLIGPEPQDNNHYRENDIGVHDGSTKCFQCGRCCAEVPLDYENEDVYKQLYDWLVKNTR